MSKKLYLTLGIPGCGKSTYARKLISENNVKRCNKDDFRNMVDDGKWSKRNEQFIMELEESFVSSALRQGLSVIVDNTHGHPSHRDRFSALAAKYGAEFEILFFKTPLEECIRRDNLREGKARVGKQVINRMWNQGFQALYEVEGALEEFAQGHPVTIVYPEVREDEKPVYQDDPSLPECVVYDLDGTVADMVHRGPFEWMRVHEDEVHWDIVEFIRAMAATGRKMFAVSGRDGVCRNLTENWLKANNIPFDALYMRPQGDMRKDSVVKEEIYLEHIIGEYRVVGCVDDRKQVTDHLRKMGLRVLQVAPGNF